MATLQATLLDGSTIDYLPTAIGEGAEKEAFFTPDRKSVVLLFKSPQDASDPERQERLANILTKYNVTNGPQGGYWRDLFCWPTAIVTRPTLGIVTPAYPGNFFFPSAIPVIGGKEKRGDWFILPRPRRLVPEAQRGSLLTLLQISVLLARAVRRLHMAGLAHSDLSYKNVLIDPEGGKCAVIDIDTVVVPGVHPPKVMGTKGYIAPEVIASSGAITPSIETDLHALPVLIYEYLFLRHPLNGPKRYMGLGKLSTPEEEDALKYGAGALFCEHPSDFANRPEGLAPSMHAFGPHLPKLLLRAFVDGIADPKQRPTASEWEKALVQTMDLLLPCANAGCPWKWFPFATAHDVRCPACGTAYGHPVPVLNLYRHRQKGQYVSDSHRLVVNPHVTLCSWHVFDNVWPGPDADRSRKGYFAWHQGRWVMVNETGGPMRVVNGPTVSSGGMVELSDGMQILLSNDPHGRLAQVQMFR